jgi:hypothetical protein
LALADGAPAACCGVLAFVVFFVDADGILWDEAVNEFYGTEVAPCLQATSAAQSP